MSAQTPAANMAHTHNSAGAQLIQPTSHTTQYTSAPLELVVFGEDWHGLPSSTQHLIKALAQSNRVLWINSIGLRQPKFNRSDIKRAFKKLLSSFIKKSDGHKKAVENKKLLNTIDPKSVHTLSEATGSAIKVINVISWPAPQSRIVRKLCALAIGKQVNRAMKAIGFTQPTLWLSLPTAVDACETIPHRKLVYYCCDDFSSLAGVDHETVSQHEEKLVNNADLLMISQTQLQEKWPQKNSRLLPHGVDYQLFKTPVPRAEDLPESGPVAGFYGSIAPWLDLQLIAQLAKILPHWRFVFVGEVKVNIDALQTLENVIFLGPRPHHKLPAYSQHWTVSLLPFKHCPQITHCNPLKLREYLATGTPVVSTRFPAAEEYRELIRLADSAASFALAMNQLFKYSQEAGSDNDRHMRQNAVASESWTQRANTLQKWLES